MSEKNKKFMSISTRLLILILVALCFSVCVFLGLQKLGGFAVWKYYMSEEAIQKRKDNALQDFQYYVTQKKIPASDPEKLRYAVSDWSETKQSYIILYINDDLIVSDDWFDFSESETNTDSDNKYDDLLNGDRGFKQYMTEEARAKYESLLAEISAGDAEKQPIEFYDGTVFATVIDTSGDTAYTLMNVVSALIAVLIFFIIVAIYVSVTLSRISMLAKNVRQIETKDNTLPITVIGNDEISSLASDVDNMRNSLLDNIKKEREAWESNSNLITAMSHDIRTPLTVMLGYLDLMEMQNKDATMTEYISVCRNNAVRLKNLSDDLFQYNLVFGKQNFSIEGEKQDSNVVLHMLNEHILLCERRGYSFVFENQCPNCLVNIDTVYFGRVIGNLFSNIEKYADPSQPINIRFADNNTNITIEIKNKVLMSEKRAESNKIGNKTCERIMEALNGKFLYSIKDDEYLAMIVLCTVQETSKALKKGRK